MITFLQTVHFNVMSLHDSVNELAPTNVLKQGKRDSLKRIFFKLMGRWENVLLDRSNLLELHPCWPLKRVVFIPPLPSPP